MSEPVYVTSHLAVGTDANVRVSGPVALIHDPTEAADAIRVGVTAVVPSLGIAEQVLTQLGTSPETIKARIALAQGASA